MVIRETILMLSGSIQDLANGSAKIKELAAQARRGPAFFHDGKTEWPLPTGRSILALSDEEAKAAREETRENARQAWKSLAPWRQRSMVDITADAFLSWCGKKEFKDKERFFKAWRERNGMSAEMKTDLLIGLPLHGVKLLSVLAPGKVPGLSRLAQGAVKGWREEVEKERALRQGRLRLKV